MAGTILIGCGILQEEVEHIVKAEGLDVDIQWLEVGLHDNIEKMEEVLDETIRAQREPDRRRAPKLLFGCGCLPEMKAFAEARGVRTLATKNCLSALVGEEKLKELEQNRTLVASPGWVRKMWLGRAGTALGWQADDFRLQFGRYDLILVLDPGLSPLTDEEIITCFDLIQVPIEVRPCDLEHLRRLLLELARPAPEEKRG